jgi:hypothetical protein
MNIQLMLILLTLLSFTPSAHTQESVREIELSRFEAMQKRELGRLNELVADSLVYIHSNGLTEGKSDHLESIKTGTIEYKSIKRLAVKTQRHHRLAINVGKVQVRGSIRGADFDVLLAYTAVYCRKNKKWQLLHWQSTRIK